MAFVRTLRRGKHVYYDLVESFRDEQGRVQKRVLQWLGKNPVPPPEPVELSALHFGTLAAQLMDGTLTSKDVFDLLDQIGKNPVPLPQLEGIGIRFDLDQKKLWLYLYRKDSPSPGPRPAPRAKKPGRSRKRAPAHA